MSITFTINPVMETVPLPPVDQVSSVALIALNQYGEILVTQHKERGWDIPGGHIENNEGLIEALRREVFEEAGATFEKVSPIAMITSDATEDKYRGKSMLIFATKNFQLIEPWRPSDDVTDRAVLNGNEMLKGYHGDKDGMVELLNLAARRLGISQALLRFTP
jgi:8-oxo-dGTP pyrophosphatase MutT (NUDIX family)